MLRTFICLTALQLFAWSPSWACTGQVGTVIFQDTFSDDTGGWDLAPPLTTIKPPVFLLSGDATYSGQESLNLTFNATDGDYCMDFILPAAIAENNQMYAGLLFWAADYKSFMDAEVSSDGTVSLKKKASGNWNTLFSVQKVPAFVSTAKAVNSVRVTALGGLLTVYLNGTQIKSERAQEPANPGLSFGVFAGSDDAVPNPPKLQIKGYKVTTGK